MKMEWSGLVLGRTEYRSENYMGATGICSVGTRKTGVMVGLQTPLALTEVRVMISSIVTSKEDADAFNDWLCKNKDKTFKLTLELDDEEDD